MTCSAGRCCWTASTCGIWRRASCASASARSFRSRSCSAGASPRTSGCSTRRFPMSRFEPLPRGYDTEVFERGAGLSMGQRQLVALARAMAANPDVLLVLDEATANIDSETEARIQDALRTFMENRTSILIAHRLSTIQHVDRILVMHRGRLVEQGSHAELLALNGIYRRLWELQAIEEPAAVT